MPCASGAAASARAAWRLSVVSSIVRIVPRHRRHPGRLGRGELEQIDAPVGGDDQVGLEIRAHRLEQHVDALRRTAGAGRVADDPAHGVAGGHADQFFALLQHDVGDPARARIDLIQRAFGVRPHLDRVEVAVARRGDARFVVGLRDALARIRPAGAAATRARWVRARRAAASAAPAAAAARGIATTVIGFGGSGAGCACTSSSRRISGGGDFCAVAHAVSRSGSAHASTLRDRFMVQRALSSGGRALCSSSGR